MTRVCATCGRSLNRGRCDDAPRPGAQLRRCLVCLAIEGMPTLTPPARERPTRVCACGCGRVGVNRGFGLVGACYERHRPQRECACGCGRVGTICGGGLVSVCYQRLWRATG